jgi:uncharacterized SAM-dependent methyltransferase
MHLVSLTPQAVHIPANSAGPALTLNFAPGDAIHTENSYKFTADGLTGLLGGSGFSIDHIMHDGDHRFAVTLAEAV